MSCLGQENNGEIKMAFKYYNANPDDKIVGDCVIRALSKLFESDWETILMSLTVTALELHDLPSANAVWGKYLYDRGFRKRILPDTCPACYTFRDFVRDNPKGKFVLATGTHVVTVIDGVYYDTWDSGYEVPAYYWFKEEQ